MDDYFSTMTEVKDEGDFDDDTMNLAREVLKAYVDDDGLRAFLTTLDDAFCKVCIV